MILVICLLSVINKNEISIVQYNTRVMNNIF